MTAPFMILKDPWEVTLMFDDVDFGTIRHAVREARVQGGFRLLSFESELDFSVVGFLAEVSRILAAAGISIIAISSFSRDHLLVSQTDLGQALKALRDHVDDVC